VVPTSIMRHGGSILPCIITRFPDPLMGSALRLYLMTMGVNGKVVVSIHPSVISGIWGW
jgi:hypothetical protein